MSKLHRFGFAAATLFLISFVLPAYGQETGFACLRYCWGTIFDYKPDAAGLGLYYPAFVLTNALFVLLIAPALGGKRPGTLSIVLALAATTHVLSWLILHLAHLDEAFDIKVGYFLWLLSYVGLVVFLLKSRQAAPT